MHLICKKLKEAGRLPDCCYLFCCHTVLQLLRSQDRRLGCSKVTCVIGRWELNLTRTWSRLFVCCSPRYLITRC